MKSNGVRASYKYTDRKPTPIPPEELWAITAHFTFLNAKERPPSNSIFCNESKGSHNQTVVTMPFLKGGIMTSSKAW